MSKLFATLTSDKEGREAQKGGEGFIRVKLHDNKGVVAVINFTGDYAEVWDRSGVIFNGLIDPLHGLSKNPYKSGDKVILKEDGRTYTVYAVYDSKHVSLGLHDYPDTEQDTRIHISKIQKSV